MSALIHTRTGPVARPSVRDYFGRRVPSQFWALILALALVGSAEPVEAGAGEEQFKEWEELNAFYPDQRWQDYIAAIGRRIIEHAPTGRHDFDIRVLDETRVNAMAFADGRIIFTRGILAILNSEDEIASVVGHEVAHVVSRHVPKANTKRRLGRALGWLTANATGRGEFWQLANIGFAALGSGYGRENELEADRLGAEWMARAGYDPMASLSALQAKKDYDSYSQETHGQSIPYHGVFASHPRSDRRLHNVLTQSQELMPTDVPEPEGDFWALIDGLTYGNEAARGVVRDGTFYHGGMRLAIEFPEGWDVRYSSSQVRGTASAGADEGSISVTLHAPAKRKSPKEYVTDVLKRDDVTSGEELEINDAPAFIGDVDTSDSNVQLQLVGLLYGRNVVYLFKGECGPKGDPEKLREALRATMGGLRIMTSDDLKVANSRRIKVVVAEPGQTYAELARESALTDNAEQLLRVLNSAYPNGEPRAGDYIKIIE